MNKLKCKYWATPKEKAERAVTIERSLLIGQELPMQRVIEGLMNDFRITDFAEFFEAYNQVWEREQ